MWHKGDLLKAETTNESVAENYLQTPWTRSHCSKDKRQSKFWHPSAFFCECTGSPGLLNAIQSASAVSEEPTDLPALKRHTLCVGAEKKLKNRNQFGPVRREEIESVLSWCAGRAMFHNFGMVRAPHSLSLTHFTLVSARPSSWPCA